jgi:uncharacterized repeat protein (TIGR01451 family)
MSMFRVQFRHLFTILLAVGMVIVLVLVPTLPSQAFHGGELVLNKTASPDPATVGEPLDFTITLTSNAPATGFYGLQLIDTLPEGMTYLSSVGQKTNAYGDRWSLNCSEQGGTVTCDVPDFRYQESATITISVVPTEAGTFTNTSRRQCARLGG